MSKRESRALQDRLVQDHDTRRPILQYVRHFIVLMKQMCDTHVIMLSAHVISANPKPYDFRSIHTSEQMLVRFESVFACACVCVYVCA